MNDPEQYKKTTSAKNNPSFWYYRHRDIPDVPCRSVEDGYIIQDRATNLEILYANVSLVACLYLMKGVATRGGIALSDPISHGKLATENTKDLGHLDFIMMQDQSLIRAHDLESKNAKNAVVLISDDTVHYHHQLIKNDKAKGILQTNIRAKLLNNFVVEINDKKLLDIFYGFNFLVNWFARTSDGSHSRLLEIYDDAEQAITILTDSSKSPEVAVQKSLELRQLFDLSKLRHESRQHYDFQEPQHL